MVTGVLHSRAPSFPNGSLKMSSEMDANEAQAFLPRHLGRAKSFSAKAWSRPQFCHWKNSSMRLWPYVLHLSIAASLELRHAASLFSQTGLVRRSCTSSEMDRSR